MTIDNNAAPSLDMLVVPPISSQPYCDQFVRNTDSLLTLCLSAENLTFSGPCRHLACTDSKESPSIRSTDRSLRTPWTLVVYLFEIVSTSIITFHSSNYRLSGWLPPLGMGRWRYMIRAADSMLTSHAPASIAQFLPDNSDIIICTR